MLIQKESSLLLVIDVQEKLFRLQAEQECVEDGTTLLLDAAHILEVPIVLTEQYPKGLGQTIPSLQSNQYKCFEKTFFSCAKETSILTFLKDQNKKQIILTGMEAHICVLQTAFDLKQIGFDVFAVEDAISSRSKHAKELALSRMRQHHIEIVNCEMVCYEWLMKADTENFKKINELIKKRTYK